MDYNYIPAPHSIYSGIYKLLPGYKLSLSFDRDIDTLKQCQAVAYWSARTGFERSASFSSAGEFYEATAQLEHLLIDSVKAQMVSDVPLGVFLSGGIDSSTVAALMQYQNSTPIKTFTIGFEMETYNEADIARKVAQHLNTDHTELYVTADHALSVIPRLPVLYDEPFADSSQIPTFLVSELTRKHVTVCLSGDGGDELFSGYNRHFIARKLWDIMRYLPLKIRQSLSALLTVMPFWMWQQLQHYMRPILPAVFRKRDIGDIIYKMANILLSTTSKDLYQRLLSHWGDTSQLVLHTDISDHYMSNRYDTSFLADFTKRMMYQDLLTYLPDDILTKVDRASMGVSLEVRVPLLDHRVVEFASTLPIDFLLHKNSGKWILRQVLYRHVPAQLFDRPKMGFGIPIGAWLLGPLRHWAEQLLDPGRIRRENYLDPAPIQKRWQEHLNGTRDWKSSLWNVLMFQAWLESTHP
jgi:asparagine synthase (glutamine-hydrolysing)